MHLLQGLRENLLWNQMMHLLQRIKRKFAMKQNNTPSSNIISIQLFHFYSDEDLTLNNAIGVYTPRVLTA
jgi:hypothetical protein